MDSQQIRQLLARNIRRVAAEREISLNHLADFAGISRASLYKCLRGQEAMTVDRLGKVAAALEVHPSQLLAALSEDAK